MDLKTLFKTYTHNLAVIYSHLEGQYPYDIIQDENYSILMTSFDYHYVAGEVPKDNTKFIKHIITYIKENNKKECVFFAPSKTWEDFL